jgi:hypothetical protein
MLRVWSGITASARLMEKSIGIFCLSRVPPHDEDKRIQDQSRHDHEQAEEEKNARRKGGSEGYFVRAVVYGECHGSKDYSKD